MSTWRTAEPLHRIKGPKPVRQEAAPCKNLKRAVTRLPFAAPACAQIDRTSIPLSRGVPICRCKKSGPVGFQSMVGVFADRFAVFHTPSNGCVPFLVPDCRLKNTLQCYQRDGGFTTLHMVKLNQCYLLVPAAEALALGS